MADQHTPDERFQELCAGYVLGALEPGERRVFEEMLEEASEEDRAWYEELKASAAQLSYGVERGEPSPEVKERLMRRIAGRAQPAAGQGVAPAREEDSWTRMAVAASFVLLVVSLSLIFYSFYLSSQLGDTRQTVERQEARIEQLTSELEQKEEMLAILGSREINVIFMSGMEVNPDGYGKVIWDPEQEQALLQVSNLPAVPEDKDYQLWMIRDNKPVSAGVFSMTDDMGNAFFKIERLADVREAAANAFAVTMEPKGGMPQPTGDMYLMGNM